ncbi:hypothetical protein G6F22_019269 [Rhizopus arrhizus]|nr:hypothetical protein G6F22_019269 [Rhizopus arrhizus]
MQGGDAFVSVHTPDYVRVAGLVWEVWAIVVAPTPMERPMRRLPALSLLACLLLAACDRAPAPASTEAPLPRRAGGAGRPPAGAQRHGLRRPRPFPRADPGRTADDHR